MSDLRAHLADEAHGSSRRTYHLMRWLYIKSRGHSQQAWRMLFRALRRPGRAGDDLGIAAEVRRTGYAVRPGFLTLTEVAMLRDHFENAVGRIRTDVRIDYPTDVVLDAPGVLDLAQHAALLNAARRYLGTQPILAGIAAWKSLHSPDADDETYSSAAQLYHFDCDWPFFIKFFIYLTNVTDADGPFALIAGTHRRKPVWRDGRFSTDELLDEHRLASSERLLTGNAGTLIAADTSALHRGTPVERGPRLVLQIEYAISRLGASSQYPLLPIDRRPSGGGEHTFDVFAG